MRLWIQLILHEGGASAAEYALILAIIGGAIALAAIALGGNVADSMNSASEQIRDCAGSC